MYYVIDVDGSIAFEGTPDEVENWLFENTTKHNERLRVRMGMCPIIPALQYIDAA